MSDIHTGKRFGRYIVLEESKSIISGSRTRIYVKCLCDCGVIKNVRLDSLKNKHIVSCGCYNREISRLQKPRLKHGLHGSRLYGIWKKMRERCHGKNALANYGGRGIFVSEEWRNNYLSFYTWAIENGYTDELTIDRINTNGNYEPSNCRWTTYEQQANNKRSNIKYKYQGELLTLPQISKKSGFGFPTLYRRINENGLSLKQALSIPLHGKCKL